MKQMALKLVKVFMRRTQVCATIITPATAISRWKKVIDFNQSN